MYDFYFDTTSENVSGGGEGGLNFGFSKSPVQCFCCRFGLQNMTDGFRKVCERFEISKGCWYI